MTTAAPSKEIAKPRKTLPELLRDPGTHKRFQEMLGKNARAFEQNILTVFNSPAGKALAGCDAESIIAAAEISASINLSILPSLGQSCIVPYAEDGKPVAQWQIQWKGLVALAHRTGLYAKLHLARIYEGQLVRASRIEGEYEFNEDAKKSDRIIGYYFYFKLIGSPEKYAYYWSAKECVAHGLRYSKSFQRGVGKWTEDPEFEAAGSVKKWLAGKEHFLTEGSGADAMSAKTIVKNSLNKWGPLEVRVKEIMGLDQAAIGPDGRPTYIDAVAENEAGQTVGKTYTAPPERQVGQEPTPAQKLAWCKEAAAKQGVSAEAFDAWITAQGDKAEAEVAESAAALWKRIQTKEIKAVDAFKTPEAKKGEKIAAKADVPGEKEAAFLVASVIPTDFEGADAWAIRDTSEEPIKYYSDDAAVAEAAEKAKTNGTQLAVKWVDRKVEKKAVRWITRLVG